MKRVGPAVQAYSESCLVGRGTATTPSSAAPITGFTRVSKVHV
jgi:hypothetical protein